MKTIAFLLITSLFILNSCSEKLEVDSINNDTIDTLPEEPTGEPQLRAKCFVSSLNGNDSRSLPTASNKQTPLATIQKALSLIAPGDTVFVMNGNYTGKIEIKKSLSGTALNPTVLMAVSGEEPVLDGEKPITNTNVQRWTQQLLLEEVEYVKVVGLKIKDVAWYGVAIESSKHITVEKCSTFNSGASGIYVRNSSNILVSDNDIQKACQVTSRTVEGFGTQECITLAAVSEFVVTRNTVSNSTVSKAAGGEGIDIKAGSFNGEVSHNYIHDIKPLGIYIDAGSKGEHNIRVFGNTLYKCDGIGIAGELGGTAENIYIYNNIIRETSIMGLTLQDTGRGRFKNIYIHNNTFYNCNTTGGWGGNITSTTRPIGYVQDGVEILVANENIQIKNNLFYNDDSSQYKHSIFTNDAPAHQISHNLYYTFKPGYNGVHNFIDANLTANDVKNQDPLFVDAVNGNFSLKSNSPARGRGVNLSSFFIDDYKLLLRPSNSWTLGAIQ